MAWYFSLGPDRNERVYRTSNVRMLPIHAACGEGELDIVKSLVENDTVDVSTKSDAGNRPIFYAVLRGRLEVVKYLLQSGVSVNSSPNITYFSLLHQAAACGQSQICEYLIAEGAAVNIYDCCGLTPLFFAAFRGSDVTARVLINGGAEVNVGCHYPQNATSPFLVATKEGHIDMLRLLFSHGAGTEVSDRDGMTPLHHAVTEEVVKIVKILALDFNVCLDRQNQNDQTPLMLAVRVKNIDIVKILIRAGCNINQLWFVFDEDGHVRIHNSTRREIMSYLRQMASQPRQLQDLCCFKIRKTIRMTGHNRTFHTSVDYLPIPFKLKEIIKLSHLQV